MDLFCNKAFVQRIYESRSSMRLKSNGGNMKVTRKAKLAGYHKSVWFSTRAIINIVALSNLIQQYRVTYDSLDKSFVVHRESEDLPNMEFRMHPSGLHYYNLREQEHVAFVSTVSGNKEGFTKRQIKSADEARTL